MNGVAGHHIPETTMRATRYIRPMRPAIATLLLIVAALPDSASAQRVDTTAVLRDFHFATGETMDLRVAYTTLGRPKRDASGAVTNAVLMLHGTTGTGAGLVTPMSALFRPGEPLDTTSHFVVFPDGIGHGRS